MRKLPSVSAGRSWYGKPVHGESAGKTWTLVSRNSYQHISTSALTGTLRKSRYLVNSTRATNLRISPPSTSDGCSVNGLFGVPGFAKVPHRCWKWNMATQRKPCQLELLPLRPRYIPLSHHSMRTNGAPTHAELSLDIVGGYSLIYTWTGNNKNAKTTLLTGHLDVRTRYFHNI